MIERESFWSKLSIRVSGKNINNNSHRYVALNRARRKRENCAEKHSGARTLPVGMIETKNHPSELYLNLKLTFLANRERLTE